MMGPNEMLETLEWALMPTLKLDGKDTEPLAGLILTFYRLGILGERLRDGIEREDGARAKDEEGDP